MGKNTIENKIKTELAAGNWDDAAILLENSAGTIGPSLSNAVNAGVRLGSHGYTRNTLTHVFKSKHQLDSLVAKYGSQELAMLRMRQGAQTLASGSAEGAIVRGAVVQVEGSSV